MKHKKYTIQDLESALLINEDELQEMSAQQPEAFYQAAKEYKLAISQRDYAKQTFAELQAEIDAQLRIKAENDGEKVTETVIANRKLMHPAVKEGHQRLLGLNKQVGEWEALKEAFEQRSYALKDLVLMWLSNYYGDKPVQSASRMLNDATAERVKNFRREHSQSQRRTK